MVLESAFSFLGVGVTPPTPSWGNMISDGLRVWTNYPHLLAAPAAVLAVVTVAFNFLGRRSERCPEPEGAEMTALLEIRGLTIDIARDDGPARVVDGIDPVGDGGRKPWASLGNPAAANSLTMMSLVGLLPNRIRATGGEARFGGRDLLKLSARELRAVRGSEIGFIFQDPMTSLNPVMRVGDQIAEALIYQKGMAKPAARARAEELLALVGIPGPEERATACPHELSGGMRQRVMIAMGLAGDPKLLIADEPTTALDVTIQAQIVDLVRELKDRSENVGGLDHP